VSYTHINKTEVCHMQRSAAGMDWTMEKVKGPRSE
jgi:hypothetical protein